MNWPKPQVRGEWICNNVTENEWDKLNQMEAGMHGSEDGLLTKSEGPFMNCIKAHPETLEEIERG
jgi:hypothetical protein